ncbi:TonB family protein [Rufibacter immobilis]|uniref:TonB family protein n=1 Tax=Rufibacter immobilis TaxID=1348778 RepID=UPI0035EDE8FD
MLENLTFKRKYLFMRMPFLLFLFLALPLLGHTQQSDLPKYQIEITRQRIQQDSLFRYGQDSPLPAEEKASFKGLAYFPVNEAYRVQAKFVRTAQETIFKMPATGPRLADYVKYGELHFQLQGRPLQLNVYQNQELIKQPKYHTYLFIPFTDATTGQETYATGRYMDFSIPMGQDSVWLDFNKAYNPYCAYNSGYSCPIPPKENKLPVRVEAGVKTYEKADAGGATQGEEKMPEFPGGIPAFMKFMDKTFVMLPLARNAGVSGTVEFSFVVKADGTLADFQVTKSLRPDVDEAVLHAAKQMPLWKPGMLNGKAVNMKFTAPYRVKSR